MHATSVLCQVATVTHLAALLTCTAAFCMTSQASAGVCDAGGWGRCTAQVCRHRNVDVQIAMLTGLRRRLGHDTQHQWMPRTPVKIFRPAVLGVVHAGHVMAPKSSSVGSTLSLINPAIVQANWSAALQVCTPGLHSCPTTEEDFCASCVLCIIGMTRDGDVDARVRRG